ncbi:alpha/beta hydrolase [Planococcus sp. 1R117A]|uniref:alpha/beta hydrolase n=1 Tax=Planococcus sp. 1R117A TaxID=3447020 RepID=UPI003EDC0C15
MKVIKNDVTFVSEGLNCKGWLYVPEGGELSKKPAIVMAHGFNAVKEMHLKNFAEKFAEAGFAVLVFDYRFIGESEGEPRQHVIPAEQHKDYRNAISWISTHDQVDENRIGIWGAGYSGAHVLHLAAIDPRVKVVVAQAPVVNGWKSAQRLMRNDIFHGFVQNLSAYRLARYMGAEHQYVPVVAPEGEVSALPIPEAFDWFTETGNTIAPNWENRITLETMEALLEYSPSSTIERISPTPLLMLVAENDMLATADLTIEAFQKAHEPKKLVVLPGGHYSAYVDPGLSDFLPPQIEWFKEHL